MMHKAMPTGAIVLPRGIADWDWTELVLPPRHFAWRMRGNPLYWSVAEQRLLAGEFDLVLATSMVDLATLRGLVPSLAQCPNLLYFHENQFAYPEGSGSNSLLEARMVQLYAAMAADGLLFNSAFNRDTFLDGCKAMLDGFPDAVPSGVVEGLAARAQVLPVPIKRTAAITSTSPDIPPPAVRSESAGGTLELLWNHRWEYDKGPAELLTLVQQMLAAELPFRLHLVGQQFRRWPPEFDALKTHPHTGGGAGSLGIPVATRPVRRAVDPLRCRPVHRPA